MFSKAITPLVQRVVAFLVVFAVISGVAGPRIIDSEMFFEAGFGVYGGIGKALIFGLIIFAILVRRRVGGPVRLQPWSWWQLGWFALSAVSFVIAWTSVTKLIAGDGEFATIFLAHGGLIMSVLLAGFGVFGLGNVGVIGEAYRREIGLAAAVAGAFYIFLHGVYMLWQPLASLVLVSVKVLLDLSGLVTAVVPPHTLVLDKFGITIAEFCSGVESIALFTSLYIIVGILDWPKINRRRYFAIFPLALVVLGLLNILRVYGLIMAGYYIDPVIAFSLFHTYAGMMFFVIYSVIFWAIAYKYIVPKQLSPGEKRSER